MVLSGIVAILVCMQDWKEKGSELLQWIQKNRLVQWFCEKDISTQYCILFTILAFIIIIWNIVNISFNSFEINDTSARYLLSALVQSLATIIAIVITLTLVAVQLTASAYSPRVIDVFKENKMWWLLVWYGLSIFSGLFVLGMIGGKYSISNSWCIIVPLEICVFFAYSMGIIAFAGLFWHIGNVITLLKPENIIEKLSEGITTEKILKFIESEEKQRVDRTQPVKDDPLQPILDIIHVSIMKYDFESAKHGLEAITDRTIEICNSNKYSDIEDDIISISGHFCYHLSLIGTFAVRNVNEIYIEVIRALKIFGVSMAEKGFEGAAVIAAESMLQFGTIAVQNGLDVTMQTAKSLAELSNSSEYASRTIEEYKPELREEELAAFQKIMKRCGQELEKLRAEVSK